MALGKCVGHYFGNGPDIDFERINMEIILPRALREPGGQRVLIKQFAGISQVTKFRFCNLLQRM